MGTNWLTVGMVEGGCVNSWPHYTEEEIEAVATVLRAGRPNYWSGDEGRAFEKEFARWHGVEHAVAVANGTVALELALYALGIGPGDEVVVTPRTFLASASSIVMRGAKPVFADVDPMSQNITPATVERVLSERTRAIMTVHLAGWPCDMPGFQELARKHGLMLIEDCAQAHGAGIDGKPVGSFGDAAAFSFCTDKIMSTGGEGGMVLFKDEIAWRRAWSYKDHGKDWDAVYNRQHPPSFRWLHESFGTNWRMTEMQAAIGRIQLKRLHEWQAARKRNAMGILEAARACAGLRVPDAPGHIGHAWYKCYVFVEPNVLKAGRNRDWIMAEINAEGVPCSSGSCSEVYLEKAFDDTGWRPTQRLPVARELGETSLMFLVHPTLTQDEIGKTCQVLMDVMARAVR